MSPSTSSTSNNSNNEWTILYYEAAFKGKAEFLRLILEDAGVPYTCQSNNLVGPKGSMCALRGSPEAIDDDDGAASGPFPTFSPPAIWHRPPGGGEEVLVNQDGACMMYLAEKLGYEPSSSAERARANAILLNALDYINEGRRSFHPVVDMMSYHDQKEEGDAASKEFSQTRMLAYLHHFNKVVAKNSSPESPVAGGPGVTYADFALFQVVDATAHQFNSEFYERAWDRANVPALKSYYEWMKRRPNLQAYWKSDRCYAFAGDSMM